MSVKQFENTRWSRNEQRISFRHEAALGMVERGSVLDLGSGDGLFLSLLKEKGIAGRGLDISEEGVAKTQARCIEASVFDFNDPIPFEDNTFDAVVMLDLLEHLYTPEALLEEAVRVSKKYIIISVPNFNSLPARLQVLFGRVPENNRPNKGHVYWFTHNNLLMMAKQNNLHVVDLRVNTFFENKFLLGLCMKFFARVFPSLFALSFVVKLKK